ncbi:MAG: DEAD/DEAH box helicase family protein, partial [Actinomycetota bacterium]|nr:DEAD/DEAH box helicase family protein [Actinomycetota bacterium]
MPDVVIENPILNSPYDPPTRHWRFGEDGITDEVVEERRRSAYFVPIPTSRRRIGADQQLQFAEWTADRIEETRLVNEIRHELDKWRYSHWSGVAPVTRNLLEHWTNPERERRLYFCQVEAAETAIWLVEVAPREGRGRYVLNELSRFAEDANPGLFRVACKMATGTGKTTVMAMLIAWQALNKVANPRDARFSDAFLVVTPGITIRDRLRVLLPSDPDNYYRAFDLAPPHLYDQLGQVRLAIVNRHVFGLREKVSVPKASRQILGADETRAFSETPDEMVRRVCRDLGSKRNIVVINDEAHHCYRHRPVSDEERLTADERAEVKSREEGARMWMTGLDAINEKLGVKAVYDLSATPFFLKGSGYPEATLFPWVVSDFGLIDAIEAGLVKIPRVPVEDDTLEKTGGPAYRNLWVAIRDDLPKKGRRTDGVSGGPPQLPAALQGALHSLYANYEKAFRRWESAADDDAAPPVFIVVCNNTNVSKLVFDWVSGWEKTLPDGSTVVVPGQLPLFSNEKDGGWTSRPVTILVDSEQLDSGEALTLEVRRAASVEIDEFKRELKERGVGADAENLSDEDILREVMNTVGKPGRLGGRIRCVVSVSMLTEGWDANTVTHILGIRAFGTQLLCEQVVGRGLRRRSFVLNDEGRFMPEYAEVYGVPFAFIPASGATADPPPRLSLTRVRSLLDRQARTRLAFPRLDGYKWEVPDEHLLASWDDDSTLVLSSTEVPTTTEVRGIVGEVEFHTLDDLKAQRPQTVSFELARVVLERYFEAPTAETDGKHNWRPWLFPQLVRIAREWMANCLTCAGHAFSQLLLLDQFKSDAADRIYRSIVRSEGADRRMVAIWSWHASTDNLVVLIMPPDGRRCGGCVLRTQRGSCSRASCAV